MIRLSLCIEHLHGIEMLRENGADVDKAENEFVTPLFNACLQKNIDLARNLVDNGADVNKGVGDLTPLHVSCIDSNTGTTSTDFLKANRELIQLLLKNGAKLDALPIPPPECLMSLLKEVDKKSWIEMKRMVAHHEKKAKKERQQREQLAKEKKAQKRARQKREKQQAKTLAAAYIKNIKERFGNLKLYNQFLDILVAFKMQEIKEEDVIARVKSLFKGEDEFLLGLNKYLPPGCKIEAHPQHQEFQHAFRGCITGERANDETPKDHHRAFLFLF